MSKKLPVISGKKLIGKLGQAFNLMLDELAKNLKEAVKLHHS